MVEAQPKAAGVPVVPHRKNDRERQRPPEGCAAWQPTRPGQNRESDQRQYRR